MSAEVSDGWGPGWWGASHPRAGNTERQGGEAPSQQAEETALLLKCSRGAGAAAGRRVLLLPEEAARGRVLAFT